MNLRPETYLGALALAQAEGVAPALAGTYAGGAAGTIAGILVFAAQDVATLAAREAAEAERLGRLLVDGGCSPLPGLADRRRQIVELHAALDARDDAAAKALAIRILDHYVETAEAAQLVVPPQG